MIDESLRTSGDGFSTKRFEKYRGTVEWQYHSEYMTLDIYRAYHKGNGRPAGLWAANVGDSVLLVSDTLYGIKAEIRGVML